MSDSHEIDQVSNVFLQDFSSSTIPLPVHLEESGCQQLVLQIRILLAPPLLDLRYRTAYNLHPRKKNADC